MAVDYTPMEQDSFKAADLIKQQNITFDTLRADVNRLYDEARTIVDQATDADITFVPHDLNAHDPYAEEAEQYIGWTLGHLVAHMTASNEEGAVFASLLARGIEISGRIRVETPWEEINTQAAAIQRLEESRRIVLAYLNAIPDDPNLMALRPMNERVLAYFGPTNAVAAMVQGLFHYVGHLPQLREVLQQAKDTQTTTP